MTRGEAETLLREYVTNEALIRHMYAVEAAMRAYAHNNGEDEELWGLAGLLHDADYQKYPQTHPQVIVADLRERGVDRQVLDAIASHGAQFGKERSTQIAKTLFAVDELSGLIFATALLRPEKLRGLTPKSVKKKLKDKRFAAGVNRDDVELGLIELGVDLDEHIAVITEAMQSIAPQLGM